MRAVNHRNLASNMQEVTCKFRLIGADNDDFSGSINSTVSRLLELVQANPRLYCLRIVHDLIKFNNNSFFIHFKPNTDNVGELLYKHLFRMQQSGNEIALDDVMNISIIASS